MSETKPATPEEIARWRLHAEYHCTADECLTPLELDTYCCSEREPKMLALIEQQAATIEELARKVINGRAEIARKDAALREIRGLVYDRVMATEGAQYLMRELPEIYQIADAALDGETKP